MRQLAIGAALAAGALAGCGGGSSEDAVAPRQQAATGAKIAITSPADGSRRRARATAGEALRLRVRVRGSARPGSAVVLRANCRPRPCAARASASADGRWTAPLTLTTTPAARFVTIDAGTAARGAAPAAVTTIELVGPRRARRATASASAARRPRPSAPPVERTLPREVLVIGDSLAVGMQDALRAALPGWRVRVDARIGRPLDEGMRLLAAERDPPAILAFSLFTNDEPGATQALAAAVRSTAARPGGCAVWATIVRPPLEGVSYAAANDVLTGLAGDPQLALGLELVDWRAAVETSPSRLAPDGVHATPEGYGARGQLFAGAIKACAGEG